MAAVVAMTAVLAMVVMVAVPSPTQKNRTCQRSSGRKPLVDCTS